MVSVPGTGAIRVLTAETLYRAGRSPELVRVPELSFLMVDGEGDPNTAASYREAVEVLYGLSYTVAFDLKRELGLKVHVGPLEGLWWAEDPAAFVGGPKSDWHWTAMIAQPEAVTAERLERACDQLRQRKDPPGLPRVRLERFEEGLAGQVLYLGPYSEEGPAIELLHGYLREAGFRFDGRTLKHHEVYLGDPRRSAPEKLRTIIRQPVVPG
jgi:hypothetical protein